MIIKKKKYINSIDISSKSDSYILNYLNKIFNNTYNKTTKYFPEIDYSKVLCGCENKNIDMCESFKKINIDKEYKEVLYNIHLIDQTALSVISNILARSNFPNVNISPKIIIFDNENQTISIVAYISNFFSPDEILAKIIISFNFNISRYAKVYIEFDKILDNMKKDFIDNLVNNNKKITNNINIIRCLSSGNSESDNNFKTVRETTGESKRFKLGTKREPLYGPGRDITRFHEKDCSGYYVPGDTTINNVRSGIKDRGKKIGKETSYRGDDINICTQNKRLNFLYYPETAQLQDLTTVEGLLITRQIRNLHSSITNAKPLTFIMILVADTITINKLCGKTISPLDIIELNGKKMTTYKIADNYQSPEIILFDYEILCTEYQFIYVINEPEYSTISLAHRSKLYDPPISVNSIRKLNITISAIERLANKSLYLNKDTPMIVTSSYLSRSILTASIIASKIKIKPKTNFDNISYIYDLFMYICIIRNLIIEYINIAKIGGDFFNEIYKSEIVDSYYSDNVKNFRSKIDPKKLFNDKMKPEDLLTDLGFDLPNYNPDKRKGTQKSTRNGSRFGSLLGNLFTRRTKKANKLSNFSRNNEYNNNNNNNNNSFVKVQLEKERLKAEEEEAVGGFRKRSKKYNNKNNKNNNKNNKNNNKN